MSNLTFKSNGATQVALIKVGSPAQISLQYSKDGTNWSNYTVGEEIPLSNNQFVSFSGANEKFNLTNAHYYNFSAEGEGTLSLSGDLMSLISGENVDYPYTFCKLFLGNEKIVDASQFTLSASNISKWCYANMFKDCTNLSAAPSTLPAETLKEWCYQGMFAGCSNLKTAPILPATTLAKYCYYAMFYNCPSLTLAPDLEAKTLTDWCYNSMFFNCQSLNTIFAEFTDWNISGNSSKSWVREVSPTGTFLCPSALNTSIRSMSYVPQNWNVYNYETMPLTFLNVGTASSQIRINRKRPTEQPSTLDMKYRKNFTGDWIAYSFDIEMGYGPSIQLNPGEFISFSGNNTTFKNHFFQAIGNNGKLKVFGNIMSLDNNASSFTNSMQFDTTFNSMYSLYDASHLVLPANSLTYGCYNGMFQDCSGLVYPPQLQATTLADWCYANMFRGCTNLKSAPQLPATSLASSCYNQMFRACYNLTSAPELPATNLTQRCYQAMFHSCSSLVVPPVLSSTKSAQQCYAYMFYGCRKLSGTPTLPATTLSAGCYYAMFGYCNSLSSTPTLPATNLAQQCYQLMFTNCTNITGAVLPATQQADLCYAKMFENCSKLSCLNVNFNIWNGANYPASGWVTGVSNTGTFYKPSSLEIIRGTSYIPTNWTVINH